MDDDVQYLGTRLAASEPLDDPCEAHRSVMGITLHVEKCGERPAHDLTFYRACSGYVNIGRKSGSDDRSMRRENDDHNAVFTCQVVSARHARLVLSDSGQVYVVDLHSRHGTHLLRRGETTPRMLQAEIETLLADGDVLTFGKVVGAGSYHVSPVTVRVELLRGRPSAEPAALITFDPPSPILSRQRKPSSGRYGLISASGVESDSQHSPSSISVSSDAASSPSDQDQESDVDDQQSCIAPVLRDGQVKTSVKIPAFRSFIQEIYSNINSASHSPVITDIPDAPLEDAPGSPSSAGAVKHPSPFVAPPPKSRSRSPIEVAMAPSPAPGAQSFEPPVIGAWPVSRPESPQDLSLEVETGRSEVAPASGLDREPESISAQSSTSQTRITPLFSDDFFVKVMHRLPPPPPFFPMGGPFSNSITSDFGLPPAPLPSPPPLLPHRIPPFHPLHKVMTECVKSEIEGSLKSVNERITTLQETFSELKSRQSVTEEDVVSLQGICEAYEPKSDRLHYRILDAECDISSLFAIQPQVAELQNQMTTLHERLDAPEPKPVGTSTDEIHACAVALNNLVSEMKLLREDTEKRKEAKAEAMRSAHSEALEALKDVVVEAKSPRTLKRRRDDEEAEEREETPAVVAPVACSPPPVTGEALASEVPALQVPVLPIPITVPELPAPEVSVLEASVPQAQVPASEPTRSKKRARTAMYAVGRTVAAMAVGAAATWSALALS